MFLNVYQLPMWKQAKEEGVGWWFWFWPNRQEELYHNRDLRFARHCGRTPPKSLLQK
jgi:hypothetical protein